MFGQIATQVRAAVLALVAVLTTVGALPEAIAEVIKAQAEPVVGGMTGLWAIFAAIRAWRGATKE